MTTKDMDFVYWKQKRVHIKIQPFIIKKFYKFANDFNGSLCRFFSTNLSITAKGNIKKRTV